MNENKIILYQDDNEITRVSVRFADEDLWLTQNQLAEIYQTTQENISMHIRNIYADGELDQNPTYKKFLLVQTEGSRRWMMNASNKGGIAISVSCCNVFGINIYRQREMAMLESDFDKEIKKLREKSEEN